ncbi:hypothetical protein [Phycisphaera mikurensis]|uniref:hypothetical protein n=1 Tax=Phycisphaera mikurensis TaxID=547188 RepID=UPI00059CA21D|nr:hypothetical protein [Phycisphaera mikurensis]MBB6442070.1 hypothetical protein [Phycisphaera mikurensis]
MPGSLSSLPLLLAHGAAPALAGDGGGKQHTGIDVAAGGETFLLSFYGDHPAKRDRGGRLFRNNVLTGKSEHLGIPFAGDSWPMQRWDAERGVLVAIGECGLYENPALPADGVPSGAAWDGDDDQHSFGSLLVYDSDARRALRAGLPPGPLRPERRSLVLEPRSGRFFTSTPPSPSRLLEVNTAADATPADRLRDTGLTLDGPVRAATRGLSADGELILVTRRGTLYALGFEPLRLREVGPAWNDGAWITDLPLDPTGRWLHDVVDSTWTGRAYGVPLVRYDLAGGTRTVLAFLGPWLHEHHGYAAVGAYTAVVSPDGTRLFTQLNGCFTDDPDDARHEQPVLLDVALPAPWSRSPPGPSRP